MAGKAVLGKYFRIETTCSFRELKFYKFYSKTFIKLQLFLNCDIIKEQKDFFFHFSIWIFSHVCSLGCFTLISFGLMFMVTILSNSTSVNATDMTHSNGSTEETTDVNFTTEENLSLSSINPQVGSNQNIITVKIFGSQRRKKLEELPRNHRLKKILIIHLFSMKFSTILSTKQKTDIRFVVNETGSLYIFFLILSYLRYVYISLFERKINMCNIYTRSTFQTFFANVQCCIAKFYMVAILKCSKSRGFLSTSVFVLN